MAHVLQTHFNEDHLLIFPSGFNISPYPTLQILWVAFNFPPIFIGKILEGKGKGSGSHTFKWFFFLSDRTSKDFLTVHRLTLKSWWFIYPPIVVCLCGVGMLIQISQGDWKPFAPQSVVPEPKALTTLLRNAELHPTPQV